MAYSMEKEFDIWKKEIEVSNSKKDVIKTKSGVLAKMANRRQRNIRKFKFTAC